MFISVIFDLGFFWSETKIDIETRVIAHWQYTFFTVFLPNQVAGSIETNSTGLGTCYQFRFDRKEINRAVEINSAILKNMTC